MFKKTLLAMSLLISVSVKAYDIQDWVRDTNYGLAQNIAERRMFDFEVGDTAYYTVTMGAFPIPGSMEITVRDVQPSQVTIYIHVDMSLGESHCLQVIDSSTGKITSMTCNDQAQQPADPNDFEVIEQKEDQVTVPAGTFVCSYIKGKIKSSDDTVEQWLNPSEVPIFGMVKMTEPSPIGQTVVELTSFKKM